MARKVLGVSITESEFVAIHKNLNLHNEKLKIEQKLTLSKFLFHMIKLGLKLYIINNRNIDKTYNHIERIKKQIERDKERKLQEKVPAKKAGFIAALFS